MHRSKGRCRRHYLTPRSASVPSPSREASPSPASCPSVPHAAASQPSCVQPSGLADQPAQLAAPQADGQLQPVGLQLRPVTAHFQLHPSLVHASSSTQATAVVGPQCELPWETHRLLHALAGITTAAKDAVLKVVSSPDFDPRKCQIQAGCSRRCLSGHHWGAGLQTAQPIWGMAMAGVRQLSTLVSKTLSVPVQDWQTLKVTLHHKGKPYLLECEARTSLQALQELVSQVGGAAICCNMLRCVVQSTQWCSLDGCRVA